MDTNTKGCEKDFGDIVITNAFEHTKLSRELGELKRCFETLIKKGQEN